MTKVLFVHRSVGHNLITDGYMYSLAVDSHPIPKASREIAPLLVNFIKNVAENSK